MADPGLSSGTSACSGALSGTCTDVDQSLGAVWRLPSVAALSADAVSDEHGPSGARAPKSPPRRDRAPALARASPPAESQGNPSASEGPVPRDASSSVSAHRRTVSRETAPPRAARRHVVPRETADGFAVSDTVLPAARSSHCTDIWLTARQPRDSLTQRSETVTRCPDRHAVSRSSYAARPAPDTRPRAKCPSRNQLRCGSRDELRLEPFREAHPRAVSSFCGLPPHSVGDDDSASALAWSPRQRTGPIPAVGARFT